MFRSRGRPFRARGRGRSFRGRPYAGPGRGFGRGFGLRGRGGIQKIRHPVRKQLIKDIMKMMTEQGPMKSEDMARVMGFHEKAEINPTLYYMRRHRLAQQNRTRSLKWEITENNDAFEKWSAEQGNLDASANSESFESFEEEPMSDDGEDESGSTTFGMSGFQPDPAPLPATQHPSFGRGRGILSLPMQNSLPNTSFARGFNSGSGLSQLSQGSGFTSHVGSVQENAGAVKQLQPNQPEDVEKKILNAMKTRPLGTATVGALSAMLGMAQDRIVQVLQTKEKLGTVSLVNKQQNLWVLTTKGEAELSGLLIGPAGNGSSGSRPLAPHLFMSANPKFGPAPGSLSAENMDTEAANEKSGSVSVACVQMKSEPIESSVISQATSSNIPRPPHMVEFDRTGKVPEAYMQSGFSSSDNSFGRQSGATSSNPNQGFSSMNSHMQGLSSESFAVLNKNPISALMEFAQSRKQTATIEVVRMSGPPHRRRFVVAAVIGNRQFPTVEKTSKKDARTEAADIALRTLIAEGAYNMPQKSQTVKINHVPRATSSPAVTHPVAMPTNAGSPALSNESFAALNKNPVSALMEYAQQRQQKARIELLSQSGPPHSPSFVMAAYVGDRQFATVSRSSKKEGKTEAAEVALRTLIGEGAYRNNTSKQDPGTPLDPNSMTHFDKIAAVSHQAFNILATKIPENFAGRKVIAALVLKRGEEDDGTVISVGSGNRCITGQQLSLEGNTVNDSHAEIITRRGFLRYLYQQLLLYEPGQPHDLFEVAPSGKLRIKEGITLHLYISTAPCGDGALFSPRDCENRPATDTDNSVDHHPTFTSNVQGLLRTKMEGGEGTIPIEPEFQGQTFDGIQRGERLRTMSCTDKICRWNVVGLQGALLTHFLEPIYLSSLTLGYLYDHGHLSRAVCCRLGRGDLPSHLPHGYRLNHPWLGRVTMCDPPRETQKTKAFSINWCHGDANPEVLDGTQGICYTSLENKLFSRVRKRALYDHFKEVAKKFGRSDLLELENYNQGKKLATDFQAAKQAMLKEFSTLKCGPWVGKPIEEEMFS